MNKAVRKTVKTRANYLCEYCLSSEYFSPDPFECDHIRATSRGGSNDVSNLALSCSGCNGYKSDAIEAIDPASGVLVRLYNPRIDVWATHFSWNESFTLLVGISPIGRATIAKLRLNRPSVVNLRRILIQLGELPFDILPL
jgi:HNH endonuclease